MAVTTQARPLGPWIGGAPAETGAARLTPLISPNDEGVAAEMVESDAALVDRAVMSAHAAFLAHERTILATRIGWLNAIADAVVADEARIVDSLIRLIGKPRRAATFEA